MAQAALEYRRKLFEVAQQYAETKPVWSPVAGPDGMPVLSGIPQLKALFAEADQRGAQMDAFVAKCEAELSACLALGKMPNTQLTEAIAIAKVDYSNNTYFRTRARE